MNIFSATGFFQAGQTALDFSS